uniref:RH2 domain-containing protein n=1 Tax=Nothobranchius furzeri TaxID=105023 RepID=A0A1A7ZMY7_NOTFU
MFSCVFCSLQFRVTLKELLIDYLATCFRPRGLHHHPGASAPVCRRSCCCSSSTLVLFLQLQQQQSRLMKINHDLRHKISVVEAQGKALIGQKVELEAGAQAQAQEVGALRQEVARLRERLQVEASTQNPEEAPPLPPSPAEEAFCEEESGGLDLKDPNRPRFTLQELRDVLHERNELKAKVFLLQEELAYYKSDEAEDEIESPSPELRTRSRSSAQPESGIKRLFSFFSRDKQRGSQLDAGSGPWTRRDEAYTEQAQEALQHL